jgi:hypothetical protein
MTATTPTLPPKRTLGERLRLHGAALRTLMVRTRVRWWQKVAQSGPPTWDERNIIIARFISEGSSVLDLGAGAQTLRTHLKPGCVYQPCDVVQSSPDVLFCDFNRDIYPEPGRRFDVAVCSGLLEYVRKPRQFIPRIAALADRLLLTYNPIQPHESKIERLAKNWVNHLSQEQLEHIFNESGLKWKIINRREPNEMMYEVMASSIRSRGEEQAG